MMVRWSVGLWAARPHSAAYSAHSSASAWTMSASGIKRRPPRQSNPASLHPHIRLNTTTIILAGPHRFIPTYARPIQAKSAPHQDFLWGKVNLGGGWLGLFAKASQGCGAPLRPLSPVSSSTSSYLSSSLDLSANINVKCRRECWFYSSNCVGGGDVEMGRP